MFICRVPTLLRWLGLWGGAPRCARAVYALCEKAGSHGSQGPEFCTLQPLLVHQVFCFLV